mmetsp:Transcript_75861/g.234855  ORF Transcript_75861/g.234855 Transcript_75861/m.234855 type:complete len:209 (+) Transcript_75861:1955-2581(+)
MLRGSLMNRRSICSSLKDSGCSIPGQSLTAGTGTMVFLGSFFLASARLSAQLSKAVSSKVCASGMRVSRSKTLLGRLLTPFKALERPLRRAVVPLDMNTLLLMSVSTKMPSANRLMRDPKDSKLTLPVKRSHSFCLAWASSSSCEAAGGPTLAAGSGAGSATALSSGGPSFAVTAGRQSEVPGRRMELTILSPSMRNSILAPSVRPAS